MSQQVVSDKVSPPAYTDKAQPPTQPVTGTQPVQQVIQQQPVVSTLEEQPLKPQTQIVYVREMPSTQKVVISQPSPPTSEQPAEQQPLTQQSVQYVQYVDKDGNIVPAPTQQQVPPPLSAAAQPAPDQDKEKKKKRRAQIGVCMIAGLGVLLVFIGLCVDNLMVYESVPDYLRICGWTGIRVECDDTKYFDCPEVEEQWTIEYSEGCTSRGEDQPFCDAQIAAALALVTMILAVIEGIIGIALIQPWNEITRCFAEENKYVWSARVHFFASIVFSVLSIIFWSAIDELCHETFDDAELGTSQILNVVGMVFIAIALAVMFVTKL